jgi:DNA modification methylase
VDAPETPPRPPRRPPARRANDLEGAEWTRASISVWNDLRKTSEETARKHPAMFPAALAERLIRCFTRDGEGAILDPFAGSGSTLLAACGLGREAVGFEVSGEYADLAETRLREMELPSEARYTLHRTSASQIPALVAGGSVAFCVTSPPYWDILARRRTADGKDTRDYAPSEDDLTREPDYKRFVERLAAIFDGVYDALRPGGYCVVNVMDLRKQDRFYPLHSDLATALSTPALGGRFRYDDLIIWDRRADYNSLRPLGYPAVFRINKVHEYLLIFQRPRAS